VSQVNNIPHHKFGGLIGPEPSVPVDVLPGPTTRPVVVAGVVQESRVYASVNHIQCAICVEHIQFAANNLLRADPFALAHCRRSEQIRALLYLIGICDRLNWDFLMGVVARRLDLMTDQFSAELIRRLRLSDIREALSGYKRQGDTIDFKHKADHLKAIAECESANRIVDRLEQAAFVGGDEGVETLLSAVPAYSEDPLHKKVNAFVQECVRRELLILRDPENISPAVDYHIIRLYLRTGRVWVPDEYLRKRLVARGRVRIEAITQIRSAVAEAMRYTAWLCRIGISQLNELEWLFARNACRQNRTWCYSQGTVCPLASSCLSTTLRPAMMLAEPESHHGFY
jgi:hypothetical protein